MHVVGSWNGKNVWHTHQYSWPVYLYFDVLFFLAKLDCSESPGFPYDRRDRRLCVTGCHLAWVSKLLSGQGGGLGGSEKNVFISILLAPSCKSYIIPDARPLRTFENQDGRHQWWGCITGIPSPLQERGRDSRLRAVLCYIRLFTKACMGCKRFFLKEKKKLLCV